MPKRSGTADEDESSRQKTKPVKKERHIKKRAGGKHDDENSSDSDVDQRGNIRGLIAYSDETESEEEERPVKKRKAALKADKLIKKELAKSGSKYRTRPEPVRPSKKAKRQVVESSSEEESEDDDFEEFGSDEDDEEGETLGSEDTDEEDESD